MEWIRGPTRRAMTSGLGRSGEPSTGMTPRNPISPEQTGDTSPGDMTAQERTHTVDAGHDLGHDLELVGEPQAYPVGFLDESIHLVAQVNVLLRYLVGEHPLQGPSDTVSSHRARSRSPQLHQRWTSPSAAPTAGMTSVSVRGIFSISTTAARPSPHTSSKAARVVG
jgi:hypothetical protein